MSNNPSPSINSNDLIRFMSWIGRVIGWYVSIKFIQNIDIDQATIDRATFNLGWFMAGIIDKPPIWLLIVVLFILAYGIPFTIVGIGGEIGRFVFTKVTTLIQSSKS